MEPTVDLEIFSRQRVSKEAQKRPIIWIDRSCPSCASTRIDWYMGVDYIVYQCHGCREVW